MFGRVLCFSVRASAAVAVLVSCLGAGVCAAYAAWPIEPGADSVLGYGAGYVRDGRSVTHTGLDLRGAEGVRVLAPVAGEITFCGRVPSGAGTVLALTITTGDGLKLTLMPLLAADVVKGQQVDESRPLATLAGTGDPSSVESHLHVGLRRGDAYLDPATLLGPAAPVPTDNEPEVPQEPPAVATVVAAAPSEQPMVVVPTGAAAVPVSAEAPQPAADVPASGAEADQQALVQNVAALPDPDLAGSAGNAAAPGEGVTTVRALRAQVIRTPHTSALQRVGMHRPGRSAPALVLLTAGTMALWPLWRKRGHPVPDVRPRFDDVAAAVSR